MKTFCALALVPIVVSCHLDKLLSGAGGKPPPSQAPPARVVFSTSLYSTRAGEPISPPVQVTVQDSAGRATLRDTLVTLSLGANPSGDSLRGQKQVRSVNGVATFAELRLAKAGSGYTLTAAGPGLQPDTSRAFSVMPAAATQLAFTVHPSVAMQDSAINPPVQVTAYDSLGNKATNFTGPIRVAIGTDGSVSKNATLSGAPNPVTALAGVATFPSLRIDQTGVGYTLTAAFGGTAPAATSAAFDITPGPPPPPPPPTHLGFTQQPQTTAAGATIAPPVQVAALDAAEHVVQGFTGAITLALGANAGGGTLSGGAPMNTVNGVATFPGLSIDKPGNGYTLRATASGLTPGTSVAFDVTAPPNQPPTAAFTSSCTGLTCNFTSTSSDPDGSITGYSWTFGDGVTSTAQNPSHTYGAGGTFTVTLTVTDNQGATGSVSNTVTVTAPPPPNHAPIVDAGGDQTVPLSVLTFTLSASFSDPDNDGPWTYTIDWGDGGSSQGIAPSQGAISATHRYPALLGSYTLRVTVTDNHGLSGSGTATITVIL